jgi:hypothetical protein
MHVVQVVAALNVLYVDIHRYNVGRSSISDSSSIYMPNFILLFCNIQKFLCSQICLIHILRIKDQ